MSLALAGMLCAGSAFAQGNPAAIQEFNLGNQAYQNGSMNEAIKHLNRATQIDPRYSDAYYNLGAVYFIAARYPEAKSAYESALALSPGDNGAKYYLGLTLEKLKQPDQAILVLSRIPANDSKAPLAQAKISELRAQMAKSSLGSTGSVTARPVQPANPANPPNAGTPAAAPAKLVLEAFSKGYSGPTGMTFGPGGFMYVCSFIDNQIYKVGAGGEKQVFLKGDPIKGPMSIAYNEAANELYVANYHGGNVVRISPAGKATTLMGGLKKPYSLLLDIQNHILYISEQENNSVQKIKLAR